MDIIVSFADKDKGYTPGVELGRLLQKMEDSKNHIDNNGFPVRLENKKQLIDCCKHYNYIPVFGNVWFNEWVDFMAIKNNSLNN